MNIKYAMAGVFICFGLVSAQNGTSPGWNQFRGPMRTGHVMGEKDVFAAANGLRVAWQKEVSRSGYSGLAVSAGLVYAMVSDGEFDSLLALDTEQGREVWRYRLDEAYQGHSGSRGGPNSTPTVDGEVVFALSPHGKLYALDNRIGALIWGADLKRDFGGKEPFYGFATAPLVTGERLIVQVNGSAENGLLVLDKRTGTRLWGRGLEQMEYTSPVLSTLAGRRQLLVRTAKHLFSLAPTSGETLWRLPAEEGSTTSPLVLPDDRVLLAGWETTAMLGLHDDNNVLKFNELWRNGNIKKSLISPVYLDGHIYGFNGNFMTCIDAATGEARWKVRKGGNGSLIAVGKHLVVITEGGNVSVVRADPRRYSEVASVEALDDATVSPPAFYHGRVYVRGLKTIACVEVDRS